MLRSSLSRLRFLSTTSGKHLLSLSLVTIILLLPSVWSRSLRHLGLDTKRADVTNAKRLNADRLETVQRFSHDVSNMEIRDILQKAGGSNLANQQRLDLAITVVTNVREKEEAGEIYQPRYLRQVVTQLLTLLNNSIPLTTKIFICNVERPWKNHFEALGFSSHFTLFNRPIFPGSGPDPVDTFEMEKRDYVFCLNQTFQHHPRYALILEDDAVPQENMWQAIRFVISKLDNTILRGESHQKTNHVAFVKLYHPEHLLEYSGMDWERVCELVGIAFLFGTIFSVFYFWILTKLKLKDLNIYHLWIVIMMLTILALFVVGRSPMLQLRRFLGPAFYSLVKAPSCCTQALLFPSHNLAAAIDYLHSVTCRKGYAKDSALESLVRSSGFESYQTLPNAFAHVGLYSTLRNIYVDPRGLS